MVLSLMHLVDTIWIGPIGTSLIRQEPYSDPSVGIPGPALALVGNSLDELR